MKTDEQAIRDLVATWLDATRKGDIPTVLTLMADDVLFLTPGQEPFGKEEFAAAATKMKGIGIEVTSNIQEVTVIGDWAWMRNRLELTVTPPDGKPIRRSGYTLTILHKEAAGNWVIARDANLLAPESDT
jgi:uncharacterized protein (TIGR02246 family)